MISVLPDWITKLSMQQQTVLLMALRGPDGFEKYHASKPVLYFYRACVLKAAHKGRPLHKREDIPTFMSMLCCDEDRWHNVLAGFKIIEDALPLHYYTHLMHGAQTLAYKHPDELIRKRWFQFYLQCCDYLHMTPENEKLMDMRLDDFDRPLGEVLE